MFKVAACIVVLCIAVIMVCAILAERQYRLNKEHFNDGRIPYRVYEMNNVLSKDECSALITAAEKNLFRSTVHSDVGVEDGRTSYQAWLSADHPDVGGVITKLMSMASALTGISRRDMYEQVQVARYLPSQKYDAHYDACVKDCKKPIYRRATLIVYLTDDFKGGETNFPKINYKVKPVQGKGVLFYNTDADTGLEIEDSFHAGLPVLTGEKWIANVWITYDPSLYHKKKCEEDD